MNSVITEHYDALILQLDTIVAVSDCEITNLTNRVDNLRGLVEHSQDASDLLGEDNRKLKAEMGNLNVELEKVKECRDYYARRVENLEQERKVLDQQSYSDVVALDKAYQVIIGISFFSLAAFIMIVVESIWIYTH